MSIVISVIFTVLGGMAAGGIGYLATMVGLREKRKDRHLEEHKNNLKAVSKALDQIWADVWMFVYGADNLKLPKSPFGNEKWVGQIEIKKEAIAMNLPASLSEYSQVIQVGINSALYDDIPAHFQKLSILLQETEQEVSKNGTQILSSLNSLSDIIYKKLEDSDFDFPYNDGNKTVYEKFHDLKNGVYETDYAGSIFNMVLGEDEDNWPNKLRWLKTNNVYDKLKELAEEVGKEFGGNLNKLRDLHDQLFHDIEETKNEIERIDLTTRLKGRCRYL